MSYSIGNVEAMRAQVPGGWLVWVSYSHAGVSGMLANPSVVYVPGGSHGWICESGVVFGGKFAAPGEKGEKGPGRRTMPCGGRDSGGTGRSRPDVSRRSGEPYSVTSPPQLRAIQAIASG